MKFKLIFIAIVLTVIFSATGASAVNSVEIQASIDQLALQIAILKARIAQFTKSQAPTDSAWCHTFNVNLGYANSGTDEVKALHTALEREGISYFPDSDYLYRQATAKAVAEFQKKYAAEVLSPYKLFNGTGYTGKTTRKKLNQLYGCLPNDNAGQLTPTTCTPNWQCGSWGSCLDGEQTRSCTDYNFCNTSTNKPAAQQSCTIDSIISQLPHKTEDRTILSRTKIIEETNLQRQKNGLPPLIENEKLNTAAVAKVMDMFKYQYVAHVSPTGVDPEQLIKSFDYFYINAGENLILGIFNDEKEVVQNWMASPGHRKNILSSKYAEIGVSIMKGVFKEKTVWIGAQEFGLSISVCAAPDTNLNSKINGNKTTLNNLSSQISTKNNEINKTPSGSAYYSQLIDEYNQLIKNYNSLFQETQQSISQYNQQLDSFNQCITKLKS